MHHVTQGWERFDLESSSSSCEMSATRCLTLNTSEQRTSEGRQTLYALALIFSKTSKGPFFLALSFLFSRGGMRSGVKTAQTKSLTLNCTFRWCRSMSDLYFAKETFKLSWNWEWIKDKSTAKSTAWPCSRVAYGVTPRSTGPRGMMP